MGAAGNPGEMGISESQEPFMRNKEAAAPAGIAAAGAARATVSLHGIPRPRPVHHPGAKWASYNLKRVLSRRGVFLFFQEMPQDCKRPPAGAIKNEGGIGP